MLGDECTFTFTFTHQEWAARHGVLGDEDGGAEHLFPRSPRPTVFGEPTPHVPRGRGTSQLLRCVGCAAPGGWGPCLPTS